jgi:hypothetical protein
MRPLSNGDGFNAFEWQLTAGHAAHMKPACSGFGPTIIRDAALGDIDELACVWVEGWNDAHAQILPPELARFRTLSYLRARLAGSLADTSVAVIRRASCRLRDGEEG